MFDEKDLVAMFGMFDVTGCVHMQRGYLCQKLMLLLLVFSIFMHISLQNLYKKFVQSLLY